jgi:hypothetical protein
MPIKPGRSSALIPSRQDAVIEDDVAARAKEQLTALGGEAELIVRERVLIARLRPVWPAGGGEA